MCTPAPAGPEEAVVALARWGAPPSMPVTDVLALLSSSPLTAQTLVVASAVQGRLLLPAERVALLSLWTKATSWLTAQVDAAVVAVAGAVEPEGHDWRRDEVALAMRTSTRTSPKRVVQARQRTGRLARVGEALAAGILLPGQADDAVDELINATDATVELVCDRVLPGAEVQTRAQFLKALTRAVIAADPPAAAERHERATADRGVWMRPQPDGMAEVVTLMTAVEAVTFIRRLDDAARKRIADYKAAAAAAAAAGAGHVDIPLMGPARCDVLMDWALGSVVPASGDVSTGGDADETAASGAVCGRRIEVGLTMTMNTYLGHTDDPVLLEGYGPICAEQARGLLPEAMFRRLVTDDLTGELLDRSPHTYRPPKQLADFVRAREPRCVILGCAQPSRLCDLDHRQPFRPGGGTTTADNLDPLCERHHIMKHKGGWRLLADALGNRFLVTAAGVRYPLRREVIDPSYDGRGHVPTPHADAALLEQAITHAGLWATEQARRTADADADPPF